MLSIKETNAGWWSNDVCIYRLASYLCQWRVLGSSERKDSFCRCAKMAGQVEAPMFLEFASSTYLNFNKALEIGNSWIILTHLSKFLSEVAHPKEACCQGWRWKACRCLPRPGQGVSQVVWAALMPGLLWELAECAVPTVGLSVLCPNHIASRVW